MKTLTLPWTAPSPYRRREVIQGIGRTAIQIRLSEDTSLPGGAVGKATSHADEPAPARRTASPESGRGLPASRAFQNSDRQLALQNVVVETDTDGDKRKQPEPPRRSGEAGADQGKRDLATGRADDLRIPTKPAMHSNMKPATYSDPKPARIPI